MFYDRLNNLSNEKILRRRENVKNELESLEKSLEFIPENSILGYMSVSAAIALRKSELKKIDEIIVDRGLTV